MQYSRTTYPWPLMLRLKQPSRSQPRESAPHCKIRIKNIKAVVKKPMVYLSNVLLIAKIVA